MSAVTPKADQIPHRSETTLSAISRSDRPLRITHVARASAGRRKVESLSVLAALVAGQPILEPIILGFVGDKDMGSELQNRRVIEGPGRDIDQLS